MDGVTRVDLRGVMAPLNFMVPLAEKPFSYNYDPPTGTPLPNSEMIACTAMSSTRARCGTCCRSTVRDS
jgi:hypothetical protein